MKSSGLSLLGLGTVAFGWILMFVLPTTRFFAWIIVGIGVAVLAGGVIVDFRRMRRALASGRGRFGVSTSVAVSLFLGIVLVVNAISVSQHLRFDFTGLDQYTLSSRTKDALAELDSDVEVVTLFTPAVSLTVRDYARNLLDEYLVHTNAITVRHVDPELEPDVARRYGLDQSDARVGVVIFRSTEGERRIRGPRVTAEAEHAFTSAIFEVTGRSRKTVYYVIGHGEQPLATEYSAAGEGLLDNLFEVEQIDLARAGTIPEDAAALVIAGPRQPLAASERALIDDYLVDDGSLLLLLDPNPPASFRALVSDWGVRVEDGAIIDPESFVAPFRSSPLVDESRNAFRVDATVFPGATAMLPRAERPDGVQIEPIAWTTDRAWLEQTSEPGDEATFDEDNERAGPLAIAVAIAAGSADVSSPADATTRIIVAGDSDFAGNRNFRNEGNSAFFLTAVNWLTAGEELVQIDRRPLVTRRLLLTPEQVRFLHFSSIGLLPLLLLIAGGYVWWRRRR
ncbi:MAG: GldG family protein [bacterium]